jgi:hypothetical protein
MAVKALSITKILDVVGSPAGLREMMARAGQPAPSLNSIKLWISRDHVAGSSWAAPLLFALATEKNINPLDLLDDVELSAEELAEELGL